jgi:2-amino-4-hydroxy-6-hydroxymethyldihydropteridine diphosphokinase
MSKDVGWLKNDVRVNLKKVETAYIGLGGNVPSASGAPETTLAVAVVRLGAFGHVALRSRLYSTAPVGYADQPRFVNAAVALETELSARELLDALLRIEREFGRDRNNAIPNGPRTLDLDILLYGQQVLREPGIEVPHPRLAERAFVLVPLSEIAPDAVVPGLNASVKELLESLHANAAQETNAVLAFDSHLWTGA